MLNHSLVFVRDCSLRALGIVMGSKFGVARGKKNCFAKKIPKTFTPCPKNSMDLNKCGVMFGRSIITIHFHADAYYSYTSPQVQSQVSCATLTNIFILNHYNLQRAALTKACDRSCFTTFLVFLLF